MADLDSVVCPQCKVGFAPGTILCPICKVELGFDHESGGTAAPVMLYDDLASLEELRTASTDWIQHLQEKLAQAGIPHRIEVSSRGHYNLSVYVRPGDLLRAKDIDREVFILEVPGTDGMRRVEDLDFWSCPGCGSRLGESDQECKGCGLVLSPTEGWSCRNCDGEVEVDVKVCPHCGASIDWSKV